ncbi:MAG: hypothetical protein D6761_09425 [Candidatus Dadabacteria bacterium]|nr:MAG: hypothetical protein D6761_09425 [Candidatus Dadabacteria bacterium]
MVLQPAFLFAGLVVVPVLVRSYWKGAEEAIWRWSVAVALMLSLFDAGVAITARGALPAAAVLPPLLWLVSVIVTPRHRIDVRGLRRLAIATGALQVAWGAPVPLVLAAAWWLTGATLVRGVSDGVKELRRRIMVWTAVSSLSVLTGCALLLTGPGTVWQMVAAWLLAVGIAIRAGLFPFHAWIPDGLERGRIGPMAAFLCPQLGPLLLVTAMPAAADVVFRVLAILAIVTAVYSGIVLLVQQDVRRACGYLFVNQSAFVIAGICTRQPEAIAGALVLWCAAALAFMGISRAVLAVEARLGRLRLDRYHGTWEQMPILAGSFLLFGLAMTGFPGMASFIAEDLLIGGTTESFPGVGFGLVASGVFTGIALLKMYFSLFCGARAVAWPMRIRRRESIGFGVLASLLLSFGLYPSPLLDAQMGFARRVVGASDLRRDDWHEVRAADPDRPLERARQ